MVFRKQIRDDGIVLNKCWFPVLTLKGITHAQTIEDILIYKLNYFDYDN